MLGSCCSGIRFGQPDSEALPLPLSSPTCVSCLQFDASQSFLEHKQTHIAVFLVFRVAVPLRRNE